MMTYKEVDELPIYFILAMGRSGTTLMQTMLDAHKNTVAPFESRFLLHFKNKYQSVRNWSIKRKKEFIKDVLKEQKISLFWDIDINKLESYLEKLPQDGTYLTACKMVYLSNKSIFEKATIRCIIDKNPVYSWLIPLILDLVPNAKFIHLVRDARGCVNSTLKFKSGMERKIANGWNTVNHYIESFKKSRQESFITLRYEDLLNDPEIHLTKLCAFLDLEFQPQMLTYHQAMSNYAEVYLNAPKDKRTTQLRQLGFEQVHNNITKPINPLRIDSWKNKMSKKQIDQVSSISQFYLNKYGYLDNINQAKNKPYSTIELFIFHKIQLYYRLPIWLRELKSKPSLAFLEHED